MEPFLYYCLLGLGVGSLYALAAQGLVIIYRGSGILNFSQAALGMIGAYTFFELHGGGMPYLFAFLIAVAAAAAVGALFHLIVLRRLNDAAPLMRLVATLALLIFVQGIASVKYGSSVLSVDTPFPHNIVEFTEIVKVSADRLYLIGIAVVATATLTVLYRYSKFGMATTAVAENQRAAAAAGLSPDLIAASNWALGSAFAAGAAILIVPVTGLSITTLTTLTFTSLAAGLVGGFRSFSLVLIGGLLIGVVETQFGRLQVTGLSSTVPLIIIIVVLVLRGRALPLRDHFLQRPPRAGTGRIRPGLVLLGCAMFAAATLLLDATWSEALTVTFSTGIVLLSLVVLTGYTGQLSLGQWAVAGMGAFIAGRLVATQAWPFEAAIVVGALGAGLVGLVFALPAVRTRGVNLAVVTLGLGSALALTVFSNVEFTGGLNGTEVGGQSFFGIDVNSVAHPGRYAGLTFACFVALALAVANLRRGRVGRRMLAIRANERAAAALGISVPAVKLYAFGVAAAIAGVGGIMFAFRGETVLFQEFQGTDSITLVGFAVIGGIAWAAGAGIGGTLAVGALGAQLVSVIWPSAESYILAFSGVILILTVLANPDGVAFETDRQIKAVGAFLSRRFRSGGKQDAAAEDEDSRPTPRFDDKVLAPTRIEDPATLEVTDLEVRYGTVVAVDRVSLAVRPGHITGLIGPNGAGKTSLIDAVSGFTRASGGKVVLGDRDIGRVSAAQRARAGISRSFQGLDLFEDMTVLDNLRTAFERQDPFSYLLDPVYPRQEEVPAFVEALIQEFNLSPVLESRVEDLPYGIRRLVAIARAAATKPKILLLDEPAAGLSETESREVALVVQRLAAGWGIGILLVEHDIDFVMAVCDEVVVLDFGHCIARADAQTVRNDERVIDAYLGTDDNSAAEASSESGTAGAGR